MPGGKFCGRCGASLLQQAQPQQAQPQPIQQAQPQQQAAPAASSFMSAIASTPASQPVQTEDDAEEESAPTSLASPAMRHHVPKVTKAAQTPAPAAQTSGPAATRRPNPFDDDSEATFVLPPALRHKTPKAQYAGQPTPAQNTQQNAGYATAQQQYAQPQPVPQQYAQPQQPYAQPQPSYPTQQNAYQQNTVMPAQQPQPVESLVHMPEESSPAPATKKRRRLRKQKAEERQAAQLEAQQAAQQAQSYLVGPRADQPAQNLTQPAPFAPTSKAPQGEEEPKNDAPLTSSSEVPQEEKKGHKASAIVMTVALVLMVAAGGFAGYEAFLDPARASAQPAATATVDRSQYDGTWIEVIQNADGTMKTGNVYTVSGNNVCQYTSQDAQGVAPETCSWAVSDTGVVRISFADHGSVPLVFNSDKTALVPATATPGGTILRRVDTK